MVKNFFKRGGADTASRPPPVVVKGLDRTNESYELRSNNSNNKECVLCVGSIGAGKSTVIRCVTGAQPEASDDPKHFQVVRGNTEGGPVWVDTSGLDWEDKHFEDEEELQEALLQFMDNQVQFWKSVLSKSVHSY